MTLPAKVKTWEYSVNNRVFADSGGRTDNEDFGDDQRNLLIDIKNAMTDQGVYTDASGTPLANLTTPWAVEGSSDFVASNMAGTDLWADVSDLRMSQKGLAQAHSWLVLSQAAVGGNGLHVLWNHEGANGGDGGLMDVYISENGFGVANGGTDGSITARPTATDEQLICDGNVFGIEGNWGSGFSGTGARDYSWHFMTSSDGQCTRVIICLNGNPIGLWIFDTARDPVTGWTEAFVAAIAQNGDTDTANTFDYSMFFSGTARLQSIRSGIGKVRLFATSEGFGTANLPIGQKNNYPNQVNNEFPMAQMGLASLDAGFAGRHGRLFDMYWGTEGQRSGKTLPGDGTKLWAQFGDIIMPWNGSQPIVR